ncbi:MAG: methyltransferase domain-containing protein, partial [Rhodanobacteraceae bacterium]
MVARTPDRQRSRDWSPATYLQFEDERTRPARDLLAQVRAQRVRKIVDVGCGPGNSTELLAIRYPEANVIGLDSSPAMLEEARRRLPNVQFEHADAAVWMPEADVDLV